MAVEISKEQSALLGSDGSMHFTYLHSDPRTNKAQRYIIHTSEPTLDPHRLGLASEPR